ncbi:protein kinase domain-containing protein [Nannocystis pusilla]|uniref:protein kinase domain-containing protein n=1 Tax=Nannocystis pusilla TaxID=889268 RepID=UPI003BEFB50D
MRGQTDVSGDPGEAPRSGAALLREVGRNAPADGDLEGARIKSRSRALLFGEKAEPVRLGRLELLTRIGAGGMGEVYVAHDRELGRKVAVKLVRPDVDAERSDASARIIREAQAMARLTHPNVVRIYDVGRVGARVYITMEFVEGSTLDVWLAARPREVRDVLHHFIQAGRGLEAAHRKGLVHRDFKPANVLVADDGRVLVADFGLARPLDADAAASAADMTLPMRDAAECPDSTQRQETTRGSVAGTPAYMSPEQLRGGPVDARSDIFSFCVALYEALAGRRPFTGHTAESLHAAIVAGTLAPPPRGAAGRVLAVVGRGLAFDPARRFASMTELLATLERALRRPGRAAVAVGLAVFAATAGLASLTTDDPCATAGSALDAAWNDARKARLRETFAATALPYADAGWARVEVVLDAYAAAWRTARTRACAAGEARGERSTPVTDLRIACLERRARSFRSLVDALARADAATVGAAVEAAAALPALELCDDAESLVHAVRPPEQPEQALAVSRARTALAEAEAELAAGRYRAGAALAEAVFGRREALAYEPLRAEALALRGRARAFTGELAAAERDLLDAAELAEANRHDELAATVWLELVRLANRQLGDPSRAEAWIRRARAAQRRLGDLPAGRTQVLVEQGLLDYRERRFAASEQALRAAIAAHADSGGGQLVLGKLMNNLANTLEASGRREDARAAFVRAAASVEEALGPDHPEYARVLHDFGVFLTVAGEFDEAEVRLEQARRIAAGAHGPPHPIVGRIHISQVQLALARGDLAGASRHAEAAVRIYEMSLPEGHPDRVDAVVARGTVRYSLGELEPALADFKAASERLRRAPSPDRSALAIAACDVAETLVALGRHDAARTAFDEVEWHLARGPVVDHDLEARVLTGRARVAFAGGDVPAAARSIAAALELRRRLPDDPQARAELEAAHAEIRAALAAQTVRDAGRPQSPSP